MLKTDLFALLTLYLAIVLALLHSASPFMHTYLTSSYHNDTKHLEISLDVGCRTISANYLMVICILILWH